MGNDLEKAKQLVNETSEFIKNIKVEEGKKPESGAIVFKFDGDNMLAPVLLGNCHIGKALQALEFIVDDIKRSEKAKQLPEDVRQALGMK